METKVTYPFLVDVLSPKYIEVIEKYIDKVVGERVLAETERLEKTIQEYEAVFELVSEAINDR